jgi:hypothetical protein
MVYQVEYAKGGDPKPRLLTKISDIDFEYFCLLKYKEVVQALIADLESKTTLESDLALLSGKVTTLTGNQYMAVVYRSERKKIMHSQRHVIEYLLKVVENSADLELQKLQIQDPKALGDAFKTIYMAPMAFEKEQMNEDNKFKNDDDEFWFYYRRLNVCQYLREIFVSRIE